MEEDARSATGTVGARDESRLREPEKMAPTGPQPNRAPKFMEDDDDSDPRRAIARATEFVAERSMVTIAPRSGN